MARGSALQKPVYPNAALADIVGNKAMPRTEIVKRFWAYIKKHKLQSAGDRRVIKSDAALEDLTGASSFHMLDIGRIIADNLDSD